MALTPLRHLPGVPHGARQYARDMFEPTLARVTVDGRELPWEAYTGINIASMSLDLGGVLKLFRLADEPGQLHAIVGAPSPLEVIRRIPQMVTGNLIQPAGCFDGPCREMTMEALGGELFAPVIDGEYYPNVKSMTFRLGHRVKIPKVVGHSYQN